MAPLAARLPPQSKVLKIGPGVGHAGRRELRGVVRGKLTGQGRGGVRAQKKFRPAGATGDRETLVLSLMDDQYQPK